MTVRIPEAKTQNQKHYINSINNMNMTIALGPAGVGKSYVSAIMAARAVQNKDRRKIIITRPNVAISNSIGFFPGLLEEKMAPWVIPIMSTLNAALGKGNVEYMIKNGGIEVVPFETIRGRSFEESFIILDEAQNTTVEEMKAFVTRIGEYSTVVVEGDITQSDIKGTNGLEFILETVYASEELSRYVGVVEFTAEDVVRSGLCKLFVQAFQEPRAGYMRPDEIPAFLRD